MEVTLVSEYDVGDHLISKNYGPGVVVKVRWVFPSFQYLLEYEDETRHWILDTDVEEEDDLDE